MLRRNLFLQFFGPQVLILLVSMGAVAIYTWHTGRVAHREERLRIMYSQAELAAQAVFLQDGSLKPIAEIDRFCLAVRAEEGVRFTIMDPTGRVIAETDAIAAELPSHADRPEVLAALRNGRGSADRYSATLRQQLFYAARTITREGRIVGIVRVAMPHEALVHDLAYASQGLWLLMALICGTAALISYLLALRVVRPVESMRVSVARIGAGELDTRLSMPHLPPLAELANSINQTTARLQNEIRALAEERSLRERILTSMREGVLALDARNHIITLNDAARRQLGIEDRPVAGLPICEVVRRADLLALVETDTETTAERELRDPDTPEAALWAQATPLRDIGKKRIGTLVVLSDISHVRRLERIRQEFVANVSHELRTPITSIIGFAETLLDGDTNQDQVITKKFLAIIRRQAGQLQSIVRDLLLLSRLEDQRGGIDREWTPMKGIVSNAIEVCQAHAQALKVEVCVAIPANMSVYVHAGLLEQALVNMIQNAIQYGGIGKRVEISAETITNHGGVRIQVRDFGPGIAPEHLDRIFERFYRIDKGRSRELGGTGLGLSIVKHIAQAHNGNVAVASEKDKGCIFTIWLPE